MTDELKKEQETEETKNDQAGENTETQAAEEKKEEQTEAATEVAEEAQTETSEETEEKTDTDEETADAADESGEAAEEESSDDEEQKAEQANAVATREPQGFTGEVEGDVYSWDQIEAEMEDYDDSEYKELINMYEGTLSSIDEKEIVTGRIVSIDEKYVIVDIGFKSEGIVPINEFPEEEIEKLAPGDEIDVFLDKVEDREGQLILSRKKADILQAWEKIEKSYENEQVIEGYIKRRIKGGMVVDIFGIDAFLPGSQIDVRPVRDFDAYVGKTMEFQVVKLNMQAENVVVSHRALIESDLEEQRQEILETIESGQVLEGSVKNITDFGVFIDLGGVDGLLHITDLSWGRVEHPSEIVQLDQRMNVAVIDFDDDSKRVSLGLKQLQPHPWNEMDKKYPEGIRVQGRVVSIADYGAFIELEKGVEGLIHISEMSWTQHIKHPSQLVEKDDIIECVVLNVNKEEKKISLGVKQLEKDPWEDLLDRYPIGSKHTGKVRNLTNFGVFVELEPGIDGLVHISDLSWTRKINHPSEIIDKGQDIEVVILDVDFDNRRITLGHKQIDENPWEKYAEEYQPGNETKGEVVKVTDKGAFVKLPMGVEAFLPGSKVATEEGQNFNEVLNEGDEIDAYILEFDEPNKNITITQNERDVKKFRRDEEGAPAKPRKQPRKSSKKAKPETGALTLGEMSGLENLKEQLLEQEMAKHQGDESEAEKEASAKSSGKEEKAEEKADASTAEDSEAKADDKADAEEKKEEKEEAKAEEKTEAKSAAKEQKETEKADESDESEQSEDTEAKADDSDAEAKAEAKDSDDSDSDTDSDEEAEKEKEEK